MTALIQVTPATATDKPRTWFSISNLLENSSTTGILSPIVWTFLSSHLPQLQAPHLPYPRTQQSRDNFASGQLEIELKLYKMGPKRKSVVLEITERFDVDESFAFMVIRSAGRLTSADILNEEEWELVTAHVFRERMAIMSIVGLLMRCQEDPSHPCQELAAKLLPSILKPDFAPSLLNSFRERTQAQLPADVRTSSNSSTFWTRELIREQKASLELVFVVYYTGVPPTGAEMLALLEVIGSTNWGSLQETFGYFTTEIQGIVDEIGILLNIIAIEAFNLELCITRDFPIPTPSQPSLPSSDMYHPSKLLQINEAIESLVQVDRIKSAPILVSWAFILSRIANVFSEKGVPNAYQSFASFSLRIDTTSASLSSSTSQSQSLFELYATHALAPASCLFPTLLAILQSPLFGFNPSTSTFNDSSAGPNAVGYLSVVRSLVTSLPLLVRLSYLTAEQNIALVEVFSTLHRNPSAGQYCAQFWEDQVSLDENGESLMRGSEEDGAGEIVELAKARFPVVFGGLVVILKALLEGTQNLSMVGEEGGGNGQYATALFNYLAQLTTLTAVVPPTSAVTPLPYEVIPDPDLSQLTYRSTRPIPISRSLTIPAGTKGRLVSELGKKPIVVCWEWTWSGWQLFDDVVESYAGIKKKAGVEKDVFSIGETTDVGLPIEWSSELEREKDVISILDMLRLTLEQSPSLGRDLLQHMSSGKVSYFGDSQTNFLRVLFLLLDQSLSTQRKISSTLVSSVLRLITSLLPSHPGVIWTFLGGSSLLFPSATSSSGWNPESYRHGILHTEKMTGTYPMTLAILQFVRGLVLEAQISCAAIDPAFQELKEGILIRALEWVRDEIWTTFSSWRFVNLAEKFEVARSVVEVYRLILDEVELGSKVERGDYDPVGKWIVDSFLLEATSTRLFPLLSTLQNSMLPYLQADGRFAEVQLLDNLVLSSLELVAQLIRLRRRIKGLTTSLLEQICLADNGEEKRRDENSSGSLLFNIISLTSHEDDIAIAAAKVMTLLAIGSNEVVPGAANFITLLGGTKRAEGAAGKVLEVLESRSKRVRAVVWDMVSAFAEAQPSLAMLFVTGRRHYPSSEYVDKGKGKEVITEEKVSQAEADARALSKSLAPPPSKPLARTAIGIALETIGLWNDAWNDSPLLLAAVLRFFDFTWQHLIDFGTALDDFRSLPEAWESIVDIAFYDAGEDPETDGDSLAYCYRTMAKAHAVRILALDIQSAISGGSPSITPTSFIALKKALSDSSRLSSALVGSRKTVGAMHTSCAPSLHEGIFSLLSEAFPEIDIDSLRLPSSSHPLDDIRQYGPGYLYSLPSLRRKLDGFVSESNYTVEAGRLADVIAKTALINVNFSKLEAQISNTRSWGQLLEIALPLLRKDASIATSIASVSLGVAEIIATEDRVGQIMNAVHQERLSILLTLVTVASSRSTDDLVNLLSHISQTFTSTSLPVLDSVARRGHPSYYRTLSRITFFIFQKISTANLTSKQPFSASQTEVCSSAVDTILRVMITATRDIFVMARGTKDIQLSEDLNLAVSVVSQIISSPFVPSAAIWLPYCQSVDLFRRSFEVFVYMEQMDGRPLYAQQVLDLCLSMATATPRAAEQMALEGLFTALTNNALTASAESGSISVVSADGQRTPQHELWTSMLALVVALISALGSSTQFVEQEVTGFVRLYQAQISVALRWNADDPMTFPGLEELQNVVALVLGLVQRGGDGVNLGKVLEGLMDQVMHLLQHVVYALLHPNLLAGLIDAVSQDERAWIEKDVMGTEVDLGKRVAVGAFTLGLIQIAQGILDSLLAYTSAFSTLTNEIGDWRTEKALILPSAAVTTNEKASIGTIFDLASFCLDTTRKPSTLATSPLSSLPYTPLPPYSTERMTILTQHTLEASLLLAATQLGLWLVKPEIAIGRGSAAMKREIVGELKGDLLSVLNKVGGDGTKGSTSELFKILKAFVNRCIVE